MTEESSAKERAVLSAIIVYVLLGVGVVGIGGAVATGWQDPNNIQFAQVGGADGQHALELSEPYVAYPSENATFQYLLNPGIYYFHWWDGDTVGEYLVSSDGDPVAEGALTPTGIDYIRVHSTGVYHVEFRGKGSHGFVDSSLMGDGGVRALNETYGKRIAWVFATESLETYLCLNSQHPMDIQAYGYMVGDGFGLRYDVLQVSLFEGVFDAWVPASVFISQPEPGWITANTSPYPCSEEGPTDPSGVQRDLPLWGMGHVIIVGIVSIAWLDRLRDSK